MSEETGSGVKRARDESDADVLESTNAPDTAMDDSEDDDDVGPMPMPDAGAGAAPRKKRKGPSHIQVPVTSFKTHQCTTAVLKHEQLFLDHLPNADRYWKSFMHRDALNFVTVTKYAPSSPTSHKALTSP